jgi:hypothetical protein
MFIIERACPACANRYTVEISHGRRLCLNCTLRRATVGSDRGQGVAIVEAGRSEHWTTAVTARPAGFSLWPAGGPRSQRAST